MTTTRILLIGMLFLLGGLMTLPAADANNKSPANVLNQVRLRQLTRALDLSQEQQTKVQALFNAEAEKIAKVDQIGLPLHERTEKVNALKKETQQSIRPILTPAQAEKFEAQTKPQGRRKKA